jgi:protein-arginine kinase activator protein McsA
MTTKTCSACRLRPATAQVPISNGKKQWRCQICIDMKNPRGFTFKKEKTPNGKKET